MYFNFPFLRCLTSPCISQKQQQQKRSSLANYTFCWCWIKINIKSNCTFFLTFKENRLSTKSCFKWNEMLSLKRLFWLNYQFFITLFSIIPWSFSIRKLVINAYIYYICYFLKLFLLALTSILSIRKILLTVKNKIIFLKKKKITLKDSQ